MLSPLEREGGGNLKGTQANKTKTKGELSGGFITISICLFFSYYYVARYLPVLLLVFFLSPFFRFVGSCGHSSQCCTMEYSHPPNRTYTALILAPVFSAAENRGGRGGLLFRSRCKRPCLSSLPLLFSFFPLSLNLNLSWTTNKKTDWLLRNNNIKNCPSIGTIFLRLLFIF